MAKKAVELKKLSAESGKVEKAEVTGFEAVVVEMRRLDKEMERLAEEREKARDLIMNKVRAMFKENVDDGKLIKSYVVHSEDKVPATVLFKNAFSKLDAANEPAMREVLKDAYDSLFVGDTDIKLKKDVDFDVLRKLLGDKFDEFFAETNYIGFQKQWMETAMELRSKLTKSQVAQLDLWQKACQSQPDFRLPEVPESGK